jgi:hypothetical protein
MASRTPLENIANLPLEEPQDGVFETYANTVDADWTLTDVRLRFLHLIHIPSEKNPTNLNREPVLLEQACITVPWWQAKVLSAMLTELVRSYEAENGELKKPALAKRPEGPQVPQD